MLNPHRLSQSTATKSGRKSADFNANQKKPGVVYPDASDEIKSIED